MTVDRRAPVPQTGRAPQLPALTGLRFIAAMLVVCLHYTTTILAPRSELLHRMASMGEVGVSIFFILSGFILIYVYPIEGRAIRGSVSRFFAARFARIYPAYLCAALFSLPLIAWNLAPSFGWPTVLATLGLLQAWVPSMALEWNGPGWSLSAEAFFYACFPVLALALGLLSVRKLCMLLAALWFVLLGVSSLYHILQPDGPAPVWPPTWLVVVWFNPLSRLPEFAMGIALGHLYGRVQRGDLQLPWWARPKILLPTSLTASVLGLIFGPSLPTVYSGHGVFDPAFAAVIFSLPAASGIVARFLASTPMVALGEGSYSIYLLQAPVWGWVCHLWGLSNAQAIAMPSMVAFQIGALILLALLVHRLIEEPARQAIRARLARASRVDRPESKVIPVLLKHQ